MKLNSSPGPLAGSCMSRNLCATKRLHGARKGRQGISKPARQVCKGKRSSVVKPLGGFFTFRAKPVVPLAMAALQWSCAKAEESFPGEAIRISLGVFCGVLVFGFVGVCLRNVCKQVSADSASKNPPAYNPDAFV